MAENGENTENQNETGDGGIAEAIGEAVERIETATQKAVEAAKKQGDTEAAIRVGAAVAEAIDRAVSDLEDAAESAEAVSEELAEEAEPGPEAEAAEEAVEAAHDAGEAVDGAEAEVRDEVREQGGATATESAAVDQAIHEDAEEVVDERPVEEAPAVHAAEEFEQEIADVQETVQPDTHPAPIAPEPAHPWFKKRKIFGKSV